MVILSGAAATKLSWTPESGRQAPFYTPYEPSTPVWAPKAAETGSPQKVTDACYLQRT